MDFLRKKPLSKGTPFENLLVCRNPKIGSDGRLWHENGAVSAQSIRLCRRPCHAFRDGKSRRRPPDGHGKILHCVGLVTGTCFAEMGNRVWCVDVDAAKIDALNAGNIPIYEPGLTELVLSNQKHGNISFTTSLETALQEATICFIAVGTPMAFLCRVGLERLAMRKKATGRVDACFREGLRSPQYLDAFRRCQELRVLSEAAGPEDIPVSIADRAFLVGSVL